MPTWDPVEAPRTYAAGLWMSGTVFNEERDRMLYLKGGASPEGTFITLAAAALAGDTAIVATEIPADMPVGTVLHFRGTPNIWARVNTEVEETEEETSISVDSLAQNIDEGAQAAWPIQDEILIEAPLRLAAGLGAGRQHDRVHHLHDYTDETTAGTRWWHIGRKVAALTDDDHVEFVFGIRNTAGTVEELARIRFYRAGSSGIADCRIDTNGGAGFPSTPAIIIRGGSARVGFNTGAPNFTLDIDGDLDLTGELIGIALWLESPAGTLRHIGNASVTGQLISTVATGTPPFTANASSKTVANLNVSALEGHTGWLDDPVENADTATITTPSTDEPTASATASMTALTAIEGQCTIDVAAGDVNKTFSLRLKRGSDYLEAEPGQFRSTTARKIPACVFGQGMLDASDVVELVVSKNGGSGSTTSAGNVILTPIGSPG